jgi:hypothetical protein
LTFELHVKADIHQHFAGRGESILCGNSSDIAAFLCVSASEDADDEHFILVF